MNGGTNGMDEVKVWVACWKKAIPDIEPVVPRGADTGATSFFSSKIMRGGLTTAGSGDDDKGKSCGDRPGSQVVPWSSAERVGDRRAGRDRLRRDRHRVHDLGAFKKKHEMVSELAQLRRDEPGKLDCLQIDYQLLTAEAETEKIL